MKKIRKTIACSFEHLPTSLKSTQQKSPSVLSIHVAAYTRLCYFVLIMAGTLFSSQIAAEDIDSSQSRLLAGTADVSTPITNAVASVRGCTGTLITPRIVLTAGHCIDGANFRSRQPNQAVFPHSCGDWQNPNQWYNFNPIPRVRVLFGLDQTQPGNTYIATQYSLPGCVDIMMIRLTQPVPPSVAIPVAVATNASVLNAVRRSQLQMVGFGTTGLDDLIKLGFSQLDSWSRTPSNDTPPWIVYAHAHGTKGLAIVGNNIYGAGTNFLWMRPVLGGNVSWLKIGDVPEIVSMTAIGDALFAVTSANRLVVRTATPTNSAWQDIGHANNVTGLTAVSNSLFASDSNNRLWARDAILEEVDWQLIGHANNVADLASANGALYGITTGGHLWTRPPSIDNVDWRYIGDMYYRGTWDHDQNTLTPQVDRIDLPRSMVASASDLFVSVKTVDGTNGDGLYPQNIWPLRQVGQARFGAYPDRDGEHMTAIGIGSVRGRPGDSGGPIFWLRPGQPRVLIGVNRQVDNQGARYVVTFFNSTSAGVNSSNNTGSWIDAMANPAGP